MNGFRVLLGKTARKAGIPAAACLAFLAVGAPANAAYPHIVTQATLLDRVEIEDLLQNFMWILESGSANSENLPDLFTDDAVLTLNDQTTKGKQAIRDMIKKQGNAPSPFKGAFHLVLSNYKIVIHGDTATDEALWTGVLNLDVKAPPRVVEQGRYTDELVKVGGHWLFKKRVVSSDSSTAPPAPPPGAPAPAAPAAK